MPEYQCCYSGFFAAFYRKIRFLSDGWTFDLEKEMSRFRCTFQNHDRWLFPNDAKIGYNAVSQPFNVPVYADMLLTDIPMGSQY